MTIRNASRGLIAVAIALAWQLPAPTLAQDLQGTLKKIKDSGTIVMGYREQSLPFSFRGDDGKPTGYSIDLCQRIVTGIQQQLKLPKLDVKWVAVTVELPRLPRSSTGRSISSAARRRAHSAARSRSTSAT